MSGSTFADLSGVSAVNFLNSMLCSPYLMPAHRYASVTSDDRILRADGDWVVSYRKHSGANILVWGLPRSFSVLEIRAKLK